MTQEEILKYAIENGVINLQEISKKANIELMEKVDEIHKHKITKPNGVVDKRWQTYVVDKDIKTGCKMIKARTKEKVYFKLAEYYGIIDNQDGVTMRGVYKKWIPYKRSITNSENTIYRHFDHWRRYCEKYEIIAKPMKRLTILELEEWANGLVKNNNMTRKEWQNIKVIIGGIWDYAYRNGNIKTNTWRDVKITVKFRQVNKRPAEAEVLIGDDLQKLILKCKALYETTENCLLEIWCGYVLLKMIGIRYS